MIIEALLAASFLGAGQNVVLAHPLEITVVDGDTLKLDNGLRIRLSGIDAPESTQESGPKSRQQLKAKIATGSLITCRLWNRDRYARWIGTCYDIHGNDINWWMVEGGYAFAYRAYSLNYVQAENKAKAARRGVWSGEVEYPWEYRARRSRRN